VDVGFRILGLRYAWLKWLFDHAPSRELAVMGCLRAERAAWRAAQRVPAYRSYLLEHGIRAGRLVPWGILDKLPESDKHSYIDRFSPLDRCLDGKLPLVGTTIDESSGSTGVPYNWLRSQHERVIAQRNISFFARYCFGGAPEVTLNAFSMGAWATGFNMSLALNRNCIVKSTGPDIEKILSTLRYLGPKFNYLICGYPPFLKHLLDAGDQLDFPWASYRVNALLGGEGMSEELRDYLLQRFIAVYSGYGATDIEIGMAGESPVSVALRRLARGSADIRHALFGDDPRLPMVFQYNPLIHHLEVNDEREMVCTISRLDVLAPRVRYNVHDEGGIRDYAATEAIIRGFGLDMERLSEELVVHGPRGPLPWAPAVHLPFVWVFGRRDATISVMGANIYPEDVESILYGIEYLAPRLQSFLLSVVSDESGNPRPGVALEVPKLEEFDEERRIHMEQSLQDGLGGMSLDYREAQREFPDAMKPAVSLYETGKGPFAADAGRIKQRRIAG